MNILGLEKNEQNKFTEVKEIQKVSLSQQDRNEFNKTFTLHLSEK